MIIFHDFFLKYICKKKTLIFVVMNVEKNREVFNERYFFFVWKKNSEIRRNKKSKCLHEASRFLSNLIA